MTRVTPGSAVPSESRGNRWISIWIIVGAAVSTAGIVSSVLDQTSFGTWLTLGGLGLSMWSLHRLGRSGPS